MDKTQREIPLEALNLSAMPVVLADDSAGKPRAFSGVANSGKPLDHWFWDRFVIDLDGLTLSKTTPGLIDHDFTRRAAVGRLSVSDNQLMVDGIMLSNEHGQSVVQDAAENFPFQMSVHVEPGSVERFDGGSDVTVNGAELTGPISVFRRSKIHEFSFTPVGVDNDTGARFLAGGGESTTYIEEVTHVAANNDEHDQSVEKLNAKLSDKDTEIVELKISVEKEKTRADSAESALAELQLSQRKADVSILLAAKNLQYSEESAAVYLSMSKETFDAVKAEVDAMSLNRRGAAIPDQFFQRSDSGGNGQRLSGEYNPMVEDAKRRAKEAAA